MVERIEDHVSIASILVNDSIVSGKVEILDYLINGSSGFGVIDQNSFNDIFICNSCISLPIFRFILDGKRCAIRPSQAALMSQLIRHESEARRLLDIVNNSFELSFQTMATIREHLHVVNYLSAQGGFETNFNI